MADGLKVLGVLLLAGLAWLLMVCLVIGAIVATALLVVGWLG